MSTDKKMPDEIEKWIKQYLWDSDTMSDAHRHEIGKGIRAMYHHLKDKSPSQIEAETIQKVVRFLRPLCDEDNTEYPYWRVYEIIEKIEANAKEILK